MKASARFLNILEQGIRLLIYKYGNDVLQEGPIQLYFAVHDSCTPGYEHNAKVRMTPRPEFHEEAKSLTDDNVTAAVRHVVNKVSKEIR